MAVPEHFIGFPEQSIPFFLELQAQQSRPWFKAHQPEFVRLWQRPLELFVTDLQQRLLDVYPGLADVEPHYFRIQRDTRFARDKTPYKTNVAAELPIRFSSRDAGHGTPGLYVSFGLDGDFLAMGCWMLPADLVVRYRQAVDHPSQGAEIQAIVDDLLGRGMKLESMELLKRVPAPYPADHPRAELLKRKGLAVAITAPDELCGSPKLLDWAETQFRLAVPLANWLERALG